MGCLENYRKIFEISENMLAAAKEGRWEDLVALEKTYAPAVFAATPDESVPPELIGAILDNDAKIRQLAKNRMDDLQGALTSVAQSIRLNQTYRP